MRCKFFILLFVVLLIGNIGASIEVKNSSIKTTYGPDETLEGWINMSFVNENADSIFGDSEGNNITLKELLASDANINLDDMCSTSNCISDYSASNKESEKNFSLDTKQSKLIGFKFSEEMTGIDSVNFIIKSSADSSCVNQLKVDFKKDGVIERGNPQFNDLVSCSSLNQTGNFDPNYHTIQEGQIGSEHYCQKLTLTASPGFKVSVWIKNETWGDDVLSLFIYSLSGGASKGDCTINKNYINSTGGYVDCNINYFVSEPQEHYVCINGQGGNEIYKIRGHQFTNGGGFHSNSIRESSERNFTYDLFVEGLRFNEVGELNITNDLEGEPQSLASIVQNYLGNVYGSLSCPNSCVFPINIISGKENQNLILKELKIIYDTPDVDNTILSYFYDLTEIPAIVNSDFKKISLDNANFSIPSNFEGINYWIKYNEGIIFSTNISVQEIPIIGALKTTPPNIPSAYPTEFEIFVAAAANITSHKWDFGDNSTESNTAGVNKITHTYTSNGNYQLKVSVVDALGRNASKTFSIDVEHPSEVINITLHELEENLINVNAQIENLDDFTSEEIENVLDTDSLNDELQNYQTEYKKAVNNEDFNKIITSLLDFEIPESIFKSKSSESITFTPERENVNAEVLQQINPGDYDAKKGSEYIDAIIGWQANNIDIKVTLSKYSSKYQNEDRHLLQIFKIETKAKTSLDDTTYLILKKLDGLTFSDNVHKEKEAEGYMYIELEDSENEIIFSTSEEIEYLDLPLFVSPEIDDLELVELPPETKPESKSKWVIFGLIIFALLIVAGIVYIFLQLWYKRKYEGHLFKNRNNLYNLLMYIQNERKKGIKDPAIASKLRKIGWNSEQIIYSMKKHAGKRTGMAELPVDKVLDIFKKKQQYSPKNGVNVPGRFGKRRF